MQAQAPRQTPPLGVVFDTGLDSVDHVLALALLFGLQTRRQVRIPSLTTSAHSLDAAAFLDLLTRFYSGEPVAGSREPASAGADRGPGRTPAPIGMSEVGPAVAAAPMIAAVLGKKGTDGTPVYRRTIDKPNETADPVALIRNGLSAQPDGNAVVILAGLPTNLVGVLGRPDGRDWAARKPRLLTIAAGRFDAGPVDELVRGNVAAFRALLAAWPTPIVFAGAELDGVLAFPGARVDTSFAWAPHHPVADAYRAFRAMPYDAPVRTMAAALHAVQPDEGLFELSEPGTVEVLDDGRTRFTPSPQGKHRVLKVKADARERAVEAFVELASAQPPSRGGRGRGSAAAPAPRITSGTLAAIAAAVGLALAVGSPARVSGQAKPQFDDVVRPVLTGTCATCHNNQVQSGGLNVLGLTTPASLTEHRETWEKVLRRLRAGDMPPAGANRPPAGQLSAMAEFVAGALDASSPPDPGRMTAHRLNRTEYANTIRDLLGVTFRAEKYFPADDSGDGFDTMGDVLTVSPLLMERYIAAAERIAAWALSTDLPEKPIEADYRARDRRITRVDASTIEAEHRIDFAGEYIVRFGLPGERPPVDGKDAAPVTLGFWMDGRLLATRPVETKPSGLVYFNPYSEEEIRIHLPEGDHTFRAGFIDDPYAATLPANQRYDNRRNKFLDAMIFIGPFPSDVEKESRTRILICDPASGRECVERIVSTLARRAYRRPVTRDEVTSLMRFVDLARSQDQSVETGLQLALQAMLVSPHFLFRIERDPDPRDPSRVHNVSSFELASRLSYFLWSSMPDEELFRAAERDELRGAALAAQVERMLADPKASALARNFAGQWLETRNLDIVKPDPDRFRDWNAELREAMKAETTLFFEHVLRENQPISDFLDARYTFLNEPLARHYGIEGVTGPEFRRVELATDRRGGILTQASVLTVSSYPTRTSPVIRGKYVLQNILGTPPPSPPNDVPSLDESGIGETRSMREQLERHRTNPTCASCHRSMDPLGFGLENYDAIGRWRDTDGKFPIDASGTLPGGQTFATAGEMRALLVSQLPQFARTLTERMMTYALRRSLTSADRRSVDEIVRALADDDYRFRTMVHGIVRSLPFQARRGEQVTTGTR